MLQESGRGVRVKGKWLVLAQGQNVAFSVTCASTGLESLKSLLKFAFTTSRKHSAAP